MNERILKAINDIPGPFCTGKRIRKEINKGKPKNLRISVVPLYIKLEWLEKKGLIESQQIPGGQERGGYSELLFSLTEEGEKFLKNRHREESNTESSTDSTSCETSRFKRFIKTLIDYLSF